MNIKEASARTGLSSSTIRYYEKEALIPPIDRNENGIREIDDRIIRRINFVKIMRAAGMTIEALKKYIDLFDSEQNHKQEELKLLKEQKLIMEEKRDDLQAAIDHLDYKIKHFDDHMLQTEAELNQLEKEHYEK
ncbi:MerR family transcriptional regulator [Apilactobacillus sp. TMW 2.2459]|uniref:MerR family transcriptional regulator n=1 Tax=Apilactobacillus xinyiensis TaxID=2841032 RepID=UPI001C7CB000|nr:MerR family transcriptional regulator [Apilactobacillus xinyiensis]MCL0312255.1 MerR family transcriptional regulator [Apilactobacillus xinyiensis]MCL0329776.1 MerR family transcriptional regulator [Apilactobacillus xinyiensis]